MEGGEDIEDDRRPDRPSTSKTAEIIHKIGELILLARRLSIRAVAETIYINKESLRHGHFNLRKVYSKMEPKILTPEQKVSRMNIIFNSGEFQWKGVQEG